MVDQGYDLIKKFIKSGMNEEGFKKAMEKSNDLEEDDYGLGISGIKSYGDMGANFSGLTFYYNLLAGDKPQITCDSKTKKYKINYDFNWADYVNDTWDEGINCSYFESVKNPCEEPRKNTDREIKVTNEDEIYFKQYLKKLKPPLECPADLAKCKKVASRNCANYFVSPKCLVNVYKKIKCDTTNIDALLKVNRSSTSKYKYDRDSISPGSGYDPKSSRSL
jgi:hypothetical protein